MKGSGVYTAKALLNAAVNAQATLRGQFTRRLCWKCQKESKPETGCRLGSLERAWGHRDVHPDLYVCKPCMDAKAACLAAKAAATPESPESPE